MDKSCYPVHLFILSSANSYCYFHILFMYLALYFPTFLFILYYVPCFLFLLIDHNRKQVLLIKWITFFLKLKNICLLFSTLKFHVQNNNIVSALANVVNINVEIDNVNLMLFNVVNFNVYIHNAVSMLIRYYPMSRDLITLTTTLRQR